MLRGSDASHSYAYEHIMKESHRSYTQPDASWLEITSKEIKKLIALLLHFGFVKVRGSVDRNWSTETFRHGHVTGKVDCRGLVDSCSGSTAQYSILFYFVKICDINYANL